MVLMTGTKGECIRKMLELEVVYGRIFWVTSLDDSAGNYILEVNSNLPSDVIGSLKSLFGC